ncbi:hypothetical protein AVEN_140993-1, partial [Araneus ventricosus]
VLDQIIPDMSQAFNPLAVNQPEMKGKVKYIDLTIGSWQQVAQFNIASLPYGDFEACDNSLETCYELAVLPCPTCCKLGDLQRKTSATLLQTKIAIWD